MQNLRRFLNTRFGALLLLAAAFGLIFNGITKFPVTFIVIILAIFLFTWLQDGNLKSLRFRKLTWKDFGLVILLYIGLEGVMDFVVQPAANALFNEPADYSAFDSLRGNTPKFLKYVAFMWISAAIGEELLFRAFAIAQLEKIIGKFPVLNVLLSAALFSLPHLYQGAAGLVMTFLFGIAFGVIFVWKRNIWVNILVHGLVDTLFLTLAYYGMTSFYG